MTLLIAMSSFCRSFTAALLSMWTGSCYSEKSNAVRGIS